MGDAEIIPDERQGEADFVIVQNNSKEIYRSAQSLNWNEFLGLITKEINEKVQNMMNLKKNQKKEKKHRQKTKQQHKKIKSQQKLKNPQMKQLCLNLKKLRWAKKKRHSHTNSALLYIFKCPNRWCK